MALKTTDHILHLTITDSRPTRWLYRATCSNGCKWSARDVTRKQAKEQHAAHLDAVVAKEHGNAQQ